jgi:hypothetical protein
MPKVHARIPIVATKKTSAMIRKKLENKRYLRPFAIRTKLRSGCSGVYLVPERFSNPLLGVGEPADYGVKDHRGNKHL